ncbi:MAG: ABC transporter permease subunit [Chloroflexota bacterium]
MTAPATTTSAGRGPWPVRALRSFVTGISAVGTKELRGRMRGRRAFAIVTVYLLVLSAFAYGVSVYLQRQAAISADQSNGLGGPIVAGISGGSGGIMLSADVGHAIFSGLLLVLTLLVVVLAPALTTGAISMEREKGTIDLLVTTPLSTLGMVIGKLLSALGYVLLLILASVPVMAVVFVFGGVGPDDLLRAYALLIATAFGMGALGLFISALTRRTQTATVLTLIVVLVMILGSAAVHELWKVLATEPAKPGTTAITVGKADRAPEALLWLNPVVGDLDLICTTAPGGYDVDTCGYVASVTGTPFFAPVTSSTFDCPPNADCAAVERFGGFGLGGVALPVPAPMAANGVAFAAADAPAAVPGGGTTADDTAPGTLPQFGFPRDTFWPRTALAFVVAGIVLTILSAQLVAPTRRLGWLKRRRARRGPADALVWAPLAGADTSTPVEEDA